MVFEYLDELEFDKQFSLSLFETKYGSVVGFIVVNPKFVVALETERANKLIDDYILK